MLFKGNLDAFSLFFNKMEFKGVIIFKFWDLFIEQIYLKKIKAKLNDYQLIAGDLTINRLEEFFFGNSPFFSKNMIITSSQTLDKEKLAFIKQNKEQIKNGALIITTINDLLIHENTAVVEEYPFFETSKLWAHMILERGMKLDQDVFNYLLTAVNSTPRDIWNTLNILSMEKDLNLLEVKKLIAIDFVDRFKVVDAFGKKDFTTFFELLRRSSNIEELLSFVASYITKLAFNNPNQSKNKFQKDISNYSKNWTKEELINYATKIEQLTLLNRKNYKLLVNELIKEHLLSQLNEK